MYRQRSSRLTRGRIDLREPLTDHLLNKGRAFWWLALPNRYGGKWWFDLVTGNTISLTAASWRTLSYPGSYGSLALTGANYTTILASQTYSAFTLSAWCYRAATSNTCALGWADTSNHYFTILQYNDSNTYVQIQNGASGNALTGTSGSIIGWNHFCVTFNTATGITNATLYLNGASLTSDSNFSTSYAITGRFNVGLAQGVSSTCNCNDVSLWPGIALPASTVKSIYDLSRQGYPGVLRRRQHKAYSVPSSPPAGSPPPMLALLGCGA